jgi:hypothetical protein
MLQEYIRRSRVFDLEGTEAAKILLIDALFVEVASNYAHLKIWKAIPLETDELTGVADYVFSPDYAYLKTPLLCVTEAKRDDFVQGQAQCIAEMVACRWKNQQEGHDMDVFGIVSNGQLWQFYKLTRTREVYVTQQFGMINLPELLGVLDYVCAECARAIP